MREWVAAGAFSNPTPRSCSLASKSLEGASPSRLFGLPRFSRAAIVFRSFSNHARISQPEQNTAFAQGDIQSPLRTPRHEGAGPAVFLRQACPCVDFAGRAKDLPKWSGGTLPPWPDRRGRQAQVNRNQVIQSSANERAERPHRETAAILCHDYEYIRLIRVRLPQRAEGAISPTSSRKGDSMRLDHNVPQAIVTARVIPYPLDPRL